ncbi:MAG: alpha-N-arabinofuranosidase [Ruminococcaceae bacterium]|nr:alpha-N-arabinofuranosidase [Oscillospiraceae bacterium]
MKNYPNPFIPERADPYVTRGSDGYYYFTASYPASHDEFHGYDRIVLRRSKTVEGLASAEEKAVWLAHKEGIMSKHIWAPELHEIKGRWYIFFAAGNSEDKWHIRPYVLSCDGNDPMNDSWSEKGKVQALCEDKTSFNSFSLDMTCFEHKGKHYLIWAEIIGASSLFMAETDPDCPWKLKSMPVLLSKPEYPWEKVRFPVNEGASVLKGEDKIFIFFSASGTGAEYCMGYLWADSDADLMNPASWSKTTAPVLETKDLQGEAGPGHNSFVYDEEGSLLLVYHARPQSHFEKNCGTYDDEPLYDPCRHARIKEVTFDNGGFPVIL